MSRELLLLRHGKSDWDNDLTDFDRPLKDRGKRSAQRMGVWLQQNDRRPDVIVSSPAVRALETARKCAKAMGLTAGEIQQDERIYEASPETLLEVLADAPISAGRLMLVGHNPGFENLLLWLLGEGFAPSADGKVMPTAALAQLELPDDWGSLEHGCAQLLDHVFPRTLPKKFPFPTADGVEYRDRPAYYYRQSAVIPYRLAKGRVEILLVSSSSGRHWVVPKGIHEPGMSAEDSAAKEAEEEAGILQGKIGDKELGRYRYSKWGSQCSVRVFPMQVNELVKDEDWDGGYRQRKWVPAQKVAGFLKQPELADFALALARTFQSADHG